MNPILSRASVKSDDRPVWFAGNKDSEASAYVKCYADIMAETIAFAAGTAAADAGCYAGYQDVNARTDIEAIVDGYVHNYDSCKIVKQADGLGDANADGGSDTGSVRPLHPETTARFTSHCAVQPELAGVQPPPHVV